MNFQTNPENTRIKAALANALAEAPIGGTVEYARLNSVAGLDVQRRRRDLLNNAKRTAEKDCGCIFGSVRGVGLKRLIADETPQVGATAISSIRRKAKTQIDRMVGVNSNSMGSDARQNTALKLAHLNLIHGLADNRRTTVLVAPVTADPYAGRKALNGN